MMLTVIVTTTADSNRLDICMRNHQVSIEFSIEHSYPIVHENGWWTSCKTFKSTTTTAINRPRKSQLITSMEDLATFVGPSVGSVCCNHLPM